MEVLESPSFPGKVVKKIVHSVTIFLGDWLTRKPFVQPLFPGIEIDGVKLLQGGPFGNAASQAEKQTPQLFLGGSAGRHIIGLGTANNHFDIPLTLAHVFHNHCIKHTCCCQRKYWMGWLEDKDTTVSPPAKLREKLKDPGEYSRRNPSGDTEIYYPRTISSF